MKIWHNPRCSKSRQTLALLNENGIEPEVVLYLETPPNKKELAAVLKQLGLTARELMRKKEEAYKTENLADESLTESQLIDAMIQYPKLIERPVVITQQAAVLGRPPQNVLELVGK